MVNSYSNSFIYYSYRMVKMKGYYLIKDPTKLDQFKRAGRCCIMHLDSTEDNKVLLKCHDYSCQDALFCRELKAFYEKMLNKQAMIERVLK